MRAIDMQVIDDRHAYFPRFHFFCRQLFWRCRRAARIRTQHSEQFAATFARNFCVLLSCDFFLLPLRLASALLLVENTFRMLEEFLSPLEQQVGVQAVIRGDFLYCALLLERLDNKLRLEIG